MLRKTVAFVLFLLAGTLPAPGAARRGRDERRRGEGALPYRRAGGARGVRRADRLRGRDVDGLDHRGHVCGGLLPCGDACDRQPRAWSGSGFRGASTPTATSTTTGRWGSNPSFLSLRIDVEGPVGKRFRVPTNLVSSTQIDMALTEPVRSGDGRRRRRFRPPDGPLPLRGQRHEPPPSGGAAAGRAERGGAPSMSIPLVFKPVEADSMLLYDGGIYDNFPWKPLDATFGPDFIVGSVCTSGNTRPAATATSWTRLSCWPCRRPTTRCPKGAASRSAGPWMPGCSTSTGPRPSWTRATRTPWPPCPKSCGRSPHAAARPITPRAAPPSAGSVPPLIFNDYRLEGLTRTQRAYIRDFVQVDRRTPGRQRPMGFAEPARQPLRGAGRGGEFSMGFPHVRYDSVQRRYAFEAHFSTRPNFRITVGGNISSTAFNQAYVGIDHQWIGRVGQRLNAEPVPRADLHLGRTGRPHGLLSGEARLPGLLLQLLGPQPAPRLLRQRDEDRQHGAGQGEREFLLALRGDAPHAPQRADAARQRRACQLPLRFGRAVRGRDRPHALLVLRPEGRGGAQYARQVPLSPPGFGPAPFGRLGLRARQIPALRRRRVPLAHPAPVVRGPLRGTSTSTSPPAAGSRSGSISTASIRTTRISPPRARRSCRNPPMPRFRMRG